MQCKRRWAFSLIETLVVAGIASGFVFTVIIPVLIESRTAQRKLQCSDHMRQLGDGVLNFEAVERTYPSGGVEPWPDIEDYVDQGAPLAPDKQGLGWFYQILPYLPFDPIDQPVTTEGIYPLGPEVFFCPARRTPTIAKARRSISAARLDFDERLHCHYGHPQCRATWQGRVQSTN